MEVTYLLILDNQIVSPILIQTALKNEIPIYYPKDARSFRLDAHSKVLTNSESCLPLLEKMNPTHPHTLTSTLVKNKARFRELISSTNKEYYFTLVTLDRLLSMDKNTVPFPVVIKPNKGYSSVGVYIVKSEDEWEDSIKSLYADLLLSKSMYSNSVIDGEEIIIEQWIDGEEYAIDCYINKDGVPVVLNILQRVFAHDHDTSDRIYFTSTKVLQDMKQDVLEYLHELNKEMNVQNYPFHLEVRRSSNGIIPIELNPIRFAGAGTTDVSHYAYGINGAESYFLDLEPEWDQVIDQTDDSIFGFFCAELPSTISTHLVHSIDHEQLKKEFSHIMEYREITASSDRTFAVVFFKTTTMDELHTLLTLDLLPFIQLVPSKEKITR